MCNVYNATVFTEGSWTIRQRGFRARKCDDHGGERPLLVLESWYLLQLIIKQQKCANVSMYSYCYSTIVITTCPLKGPGGVG